jgi:hypothetical protein
MAVMNRYSALQVSFFETSILESDDRRGEWIRPEGIGILPHHGVEFTQDVGRKDVLEAEDAHRLLVVAILPLPCGLLQGRLRLDRSPQPA